MVNDARAAVGLSELTSADEGWRASVELYLTAEPFELPGLSYPESFRLVGPGVWEPASAPAAWLDDLEGPLVLVTASSEKQGDDNLIRTAIKALGDADIALAISTAAHDPSHFTAPSNVRIERWLPHLPVMSHVAAVLCHGGMGITQKALAAGVPVCVVPFGRDQFEVAKLVALAGCGTVVMPDQLSPDHLASAVRDAMTIRLVPRRSLRDSSRLVVLRRPRMPSKGSSAPDSPPDPDARGGPSRTDPRPGRGSAPGPGVAIRLRPVA